MKKYRSIEPHTIRTGKPQSSISETISTGALRVAGSSIPSETVCPASIEETAKLYNPNMKMDILVIPPRVDSDHVCCRWKLSMRDEDDPEYVPVELSPRRRAR